MGIERIFEEGVERTEAVDEIRTIIREAIKTQTDEKINEKYGKEETVTEDEDKEEDEEDEEGDSDSDEDEEEEDEVKEEEEQDADEDEEDEEVTEAMKVSASKVGGRRGNDDLTVNRFSDLKKLAKSRQYDYMMVTKPNGDETEYSVDPQGNLVEM